MYRAILIIALGLAFVGCEDGDTPGCDERGCESDSHCDEDSNECVDDCTEEICAETQEHCNPDTGMCEFDCTQSGCGDDQVCNEESIQCQDHCSETDCEDGEHCNETSGFCEEDCDEDSCGDDQWCNDDTGLCELAVVFSDENLEACVRDYLALPEGVIEPQDVVDFTHLECPDMGITDIDGLENFVGLEHLSLWENDITDISALAGLTELEYLQLGNNEIEDLTPLEELTELTALGLAINEIEDVSPLEELTDLKWLNLDHNDLEDISPLEDLEEIAWLTLEGNPLTSGETIHELERNGADVYSIRAQAGSLRRLDRSNAAISQSGLGVPLERSINFTTDDDGVVTFELIVNGDTFEAFQLFEGEILFDSRYFYYRNSGEAQVIGELVDREISLCTGEHARVCDFSFGHRMPSLGDRRPGLVEAMLEPLLTVSLRMRRERYFFYPPADEDHGYGEYHSLLDPYILASPHQQDAGSCLYMANTGAMEILLNQHTPIEDISYEGGTDLSERYLMNASNYVSSVDMAYFITDVTRTYNAFGGSLLNRDYRFTAGYVRDTSRGWVAAEPDEPDAYFSCSYNWIDDLPDGWQDQLTETPEVERTIIFVDPVLTEESIWNVGLMSEDIVNRIKFEVRTKRAPVIVVFNLNFFWHAVIVVGYDDHLDVGGCPMVRESLDRFEERGATLYVNNIEELMEQEGGCFETGAFYIRESIYDGDGDEITYNYSDEYRFQEPYSDRIITYEYDWVRYLANHAYSVHRRD